MSVRHPALAAALTEETHQTMTRLCHTTQRPDRAYVTFVLRML